MLGFNFAVIVKMFSLPRKKRLLNNRQFKAVLARNLRAANGLFTLFMAENDCRHPRLGVSVSKSCGNAVVRNRAKRLIKEAFRQSQGRIPADFDYLIIVSSRSAKLSEAAARKEVIKRLKFKEVQDSFLTLASKALAKIG